MGRRGGEAVGEKWGFDVFCEGGNFFGFTFFFFCIIGSLSSFLLAFTIYLEITLSISGYVLYRVHACFHIFASIPVFMQPLSRLENLATLEETVFFNSQFTKSQSSSSKKSPI